MKPKKPTVIDKLLEDVPDSSSSDSDSSSSTSSDSDSSQRARAKMINEPPISHPGKTVDLNEPPISHSNQDVDPIITSAAQLDPTKTSANNDNDNEYKAPNHAEKEETSDKNTTELVGKDESMSFEIFDADGEGAPLSIEIIDADGRRETSIKVHGNDSTIKRKMNSSNDNEYKAPNHADANTKLQSLIHKEEQSTILRLKQVLNATEGK